VPETSHTSLITGISRGLGAALFDELRQRGHRVVGIGRSFSAEQRRLARAEPDRVMLLEADLAEPTTLPESDTLAGLLADASTASLLLNAAVVEPIGAVGDLPPGPLARAVTINLTAPMVLTNAFLAAVGAALPTTSTVTILFLSSGAAHRLVEGWAAYGATKRGGEAFFEAVAAQVGDDDRIRVTSANPGVMDTGMQAEIRQAAAGPAWFPDRDQFVTLHAEGRLPDPATVARRLVADHLSDQGLPIGRSWH
jgi:benzil reductase ((S)-benzoin forming)